MSEKSEPLRVLVTGAAGQVAYSLLCPLASGCVFGYSQPIILHLLETSSNLKALQGVKYELEDCAFPLLHSVIATDQDSEAFKDIDMAILIGSCERSGDMRRSDLLKCNSKIYKCQGQSLDKYAKKTAKVLVVADPPNTNCLIASRYAKSIPPENFSCLSRLDHNRAIAQVALKLNIAPDRVKNMIVWGNHSCSMVADLSQARVLLENGETKSAYEAINDERWIKEGFIKAVQRRDETILAARKLSTALSSAKAISDHVRNWWCGTTDDEWVSMGVVSDGSYGVERGLVSSFPVRIDSNRNCCIVKGLEINDWTQKLIDKSTQELVEERNQIFREE